MSITGWMRAKFYVDEDEQALVDGWVAVMAGIQVALFRSEDAWCCMLGDRRDTSVRMCDSTCSVDDAKRLAAAMLKAYRLGAHDAASAHRSAYNRAVASAHMMIDDVWSRWSIAAR